MNGDQYNSAVLMEEDSFLKVSSKKRISLRVFISEPFLLGQGILKSNWPSKVFINPGRQVFSTSVQF